MKKIKINNLLILVILLFSASFASASWARPTSQTVSSPKGEFLLRVVSGGNKQNCDKLGCLRGKSLCIIYQLNNETQQYQETSRFSIAHIPLDVYINSAGDRIVTLGEHGWGPHKNRGSSAVTVYSAKGRQLKKWALEDFLDKETLVELRENMKSLGIRWHGKGSWRDQNKIMLISGEDAYRLDLRSLNITKK